MPAPQTYRRIATEETFAVPEQIKAIRALADAGASDLDLVLWRSIIGDTPYGARMLPDLLDLDDKRIRVMDENGVAMQVLALTSPGVQMFDPDTAVGIAATANDQLAAAIARHPGRYAGLAAVAPQAPAAAVKELDRAVNKLGLRGVIINSHTGGQYLDEPQFWPILEAAEALDLPIYIHPRSPSPAMAAPYSQHWLDGALWGFQAETGLHGMRLIMSGVFDRFPKLKIILGHMGEGIPFWLWRIDYMYGTRKARSGGGPAMKPSEYFKRNFTITTSGVNSPATLRYCHEVLGPQNVMWAVDYPYQDDTPYAVEFMDQVAIPEADRHAIYHGNAERLFKLAP